MNIVEAINDQHLFGSFFKNPETWKTWKVFLRGLFGLPMTAEDVSAFKEFTGREKPPEKQVKESFVICGRRGGKSFISAIIACYLALFHDWRPFLSAGETGWIMSIAADRQQAKVILGYIKAILSSKMFKKVVDQELAEEIRLNNQISIRVATCDFRTLRGYTVVAALCDEVAFWRSEGLNPAQEILTALRPALATVPGSMLLAISSPYSKSGPLYEAFREKYGQDDPDTLVWKAPTKAMNPTIEDRIITKALKEDFAAAKAEWLAEFRDDVSAFLPTEIIEAAIVSGRWELPKVDGFNYFSFVDPSGGSSDSMTMAIAHKEDDSGRVVLDRLEEKKPPFTPRSVVKEFSDTMKAYDISECTADRYAGEWVSSAFREEGIMFEPSNLSKSELYLEMEPLLAQRQIDLLDNQRLFAQLRGLERRTRSGGKDGVDHYAGGHDDLSNAVAGAVYLAGVRESIIPQVFVMGGLDEEDSWERRLILENQKAVESQEQDPLEWKEWTTEAFAVRFLAYMQMGGMVNAAKRLGVDERKLRHWFGQKQSWLQAIGRVRAARVEELTSQAAQDTA